MQFSPADDRDGNGIVRTFSPAYVALGADGRVNAVPTIRFRRNCRNRTTLSANRAAGAVFSDPVLD